MALFERLRSTNTTSLEDYFTRIVIYFLNKSHKTLYDWLKQIDLVESPFPYTDVQVSRAKQYPRLYHHGSDSRPDIAIQLTAGDQRDLILIEAKVDSKEHTRQLQRYAECLAVEQGIRNKILLYVTRDYDPKDEQTILRSTARSTVSFKQERWQTFYQVLLSQPKDMLVDELIAFMYEHDMGFGHQKPTFSQYRADLKKADLRGSTLIGADLSEANLWGANLQGVNLNGANLRNTDIRESNLQGANLSESDLGGALLCGIDLRGANLSGANLNGADLRRLNLQYANLCQANFNGRYLNLADLTGASYDERTVWPQGFDPDEAGAKK